MIKFLSIALVAGAVLSGCGGSDDKRTTVTPPPAASSAPASSVAPASSAAPASSMAPSSMAPASSVAPVSSSVASSVVAVTQTGKKLKIAVTGGFVVADILKIGDISWHLQVNQSLGMGFTANKIYKWSYKVKASKAITLSIQNNGGDNVGTANDYVSVPSNNSFDITTSWQENSIVFTAPNFSDASVQFQLNLAGQGDYDLYFDDVSFTDEDGSNEQITHGTMEDAVPSDYMATNNGQTDGGTATITIE